jgi:hypothetical protein
MMKELRREGKRKCKTLYMCKNPHDIIGKGLEVKERETIKKERETIKGLDQTSKHCSPCEENIERKKDRRNHSNIMN